MIIEWDRYIRNDKLSEAELENLYDSTTEKEKIEITIEFNKKENRYCMPTLWAELITNKGTLQERITLAKNWWTFSRHNEREKPIIERLVNDANILVRCAFYENPESLFLLSFDEGIKPMFKKLTHMERLALMRNPCVDKELVLKICAIDDNDFSLKDKERKELILAFCTNQKHIENSKKHFLDDSFLDGEDAYLSTELYPKLYDKAFEWIDKDPHITAAIYKAFSCKGEKKLEIYKKIKDNENQTFVKISIFESIPERKLPHYGEYNDLYKEGLNDKYEMIRNVSAANISNLEAEDVRNLLDKNDIYILEGLLSNASLNYDCMKFILEKIEKEEPNFMLPDKFARELVKKFRERYYEYEKYYEQKAKEEKGDPTYFLCEDDKLDLNKEDLPKETYKIILEFKDYFTKYMNNRIQYLSGTTKWIFWAVLVILVIVMFKR